MSRHLRVMLTCSCLICQALSSAMAAKGDALYGAWYAPDEIDYAGTIHAHVSNPTDAPLVVNDVLLDGQSVGEVWLTDESFVQPDVRDGYIEVANEEVAWYGVYPNPIPPGRIGEIIVRLVPEACAAASRQLTIALEGRDPVSASIPLTESAFALEYVGVGPALDELHVYCRSRPETGIEPEAVEVDGRTPPAEVTNALSGLRYARVRLPRSWRKGSFHTVAVTAGGERRAVLLRALPTPPPLAIMGNLSESEARQYANHLFDVHIAFVPPRPSFFERLSPNGLRGTYISYRKTKPDQEKYEPVYYNDPNVIAPLAEEEAIWAHFLEDEPDGRYHRTSLPHLSICRDVERANQVCRILDPNHPTYLQMDHGGFPRNMYIWGQIPDYLCTHAYPFGRDIIGRTREHVRHTAAASRPRPFIYLCEGYSENAQRQFVPDEMRLEVYTALACGAKSLQWYPAHGDRGLLAHPRMWNAVGRMNVTVHQVLPLLSMGTPTGRPLVEGGDLLARSILCGERALAVALVNRDYSSTPDDFSLTPAREVSVRVRVPRFMHVRGAVLAAFDGPVEIPVEVRPATVSFTLRDLGAGGIVILYADGSVPAQMRETAERARARFEPMPEQ
ncbi:MAG: hypothetical protein U9R79_12145 [Armatimonadota bacterium]|nr:hypothetical protein [Armatimonadota bacterium]